MRILILTNYGMGLYKFRKELLEELIKNNHEVYISLPNDQFVSRLIKLGCKYINTYVDRRGTNPISDLKLLISYLKQIKNIKPDVVLTYTIKPNIYGGIACRITGTPYITNITGMGTSIENRGVIHKVALFLYKIGLKKSNCVFFQNLPNRQFFIDNKIVQEKTKLIPGSGVNLKQYKFVEYPLNDKTIKFLYIGRIMKSKGIEELLEAAKKVKSKYPNVQFDIVGFCEENYTNLLIKCHKAGIINYHGQQDEVQSFIKESHAIILPSYHEGISNVLLESAATGRPVLASKVTGCLETFDEGLSGLGFNAKDVEDLVSTIINFIELPYEKKKKMGLAGRKKMEEEFDRNIVVKAYIDEINSLEEK